MNTEKLKLAILKGSWGNVVAPNDHFYRLLFRLEKKTVLTVVEINELFASYQNWLSQIEQMVSECKANDTIEDRRAVSYSLALEDDIISHIENIVTTIKCEDSNMLNKLLNLAEEALALMEQ